MDGFRARHFQHEGVHLFAVKVNGMAGDEFAQRELSPTERADVRVPQGHFDNSPALPALGIACRLDTHKPRRGERTSFREELVAFLKRHEIPFEAHMLD